VPYGMLSSITFGFIRLCLDEFLMCMHVGGLLATLEVLLCEKW
jgi:hypothetical protein